MRGKPPQIRAWLYGIGLIPAYAGKTIMTTKEYFQSWAHPRVCGENMGVKLDLKPNMGSSPRMRGKQLLCLRG